MDNEWYRPGHRPSGIPRQRPAGHEAWRVTDRDGHVQSCEVRDESDAGAGFDVTLLVDGELLLSRRCANKAEADYVTQALRQDAERELL